MATLSTANLAPAFKIRPLGISSINALNISVKSDPISIIAIAVTTKLKHLRSIICMQLGVRLQIVALVGVISAAVIVILSRSSLDP